MEEFEHMDKYLKQSLEGFSMQPKITSFDAVLTKMEEKKKRRIVFWWTCIGVFILGGILTYFGFRQAGYPVYSDQNMKMPDAKLHKAKNEELNTSSLKLGFATEARKRESFRQKQMNFPDLHNVAGSNKHEITLVKQSKLLKDSSGKNFLSSVVTSSANLTDDAKDVAQDSASLIPEFLKPLNFFIPLSNNELAIIIPADSNLRLPADSISATAKTKKLSYLWGVHLDPQLSSNLFTWRQNHSGHSADFAKSYSEQRMNGNTVKINYNVGIKAGLVIKEKWEILAGFGFQRFTNSEKIEGLVGIPSTANNADPLAYAGVSNKRESIVRANFGETYNNTFNYLCYKLEAAKFVSLKKFTRMKIGLGVQLAQLIFANTVMLTNHGEYYYYHHTRSTPLKKWVNVIDMKVGFIHDLNQRTQFQFCPAIFYTPGSVFKNTYIIKQKPVGISFECLLLFKLGK